MRLYETLKAHRVWPLRKTGKTFYLNLKVVNFVHWFVYEDFGLCVVILCAEFRIFSKQILKLYKVKNYQP